MEFNERTTMNRKLAIAATLMAAPAYGDVVERTMDVAAEVEIRIENTAGEIDISGWSQNTIQIEADLGPDVKELVFEGDRDDVYIEVKANKGRNRNISSDLVIKVPHGAELSVGAVSADIRVQGVHGELELSGVSGDVESEAFGSDIHMESVSGDVDVEGDGSDIRAYLATVSGDVDATDLGGELDANAVSGSVSVNGGVFSDVRLETVSGDLSYRAGIKGNDSIHMETVNGEVDVQLAGKVSARFDIETFNGDVDNCFGPQSERTSRYAPGRELKFSEGGGDARVIIRTLNGDVDLCKD